MQHSSSSEANLFKLLLKQNGNPDGYKDVIGNISKSIEQRSYWYYTLDESQYLSNIYDQQLKREVLKDRIKLITEQKMDELMNDVISGRIKRQQEEQSDQLEVKLGVQDFYDEIPQEDVRAKRSQEKVKQINEDFIKFREQMEAKKRYIEQKKAEKEALEAEVKKSLEMEKREQHRKQIRQHIQSIKKKDLERKQQNEKFKQFLKQYKKAKPIHVLMEQTYKQKVVLPALQESRRKLQSLSHKKKPTLEQINDHQRSYIQAKSNRQEKTVILNNTIDVSYKSAFYKEEEDRHRQIKQFEETGPSWDYLQKQKRYSQFVKDKIKPKISRVLKQSMKETIEKSQKYLEVPDLSKINQVGLGYLQYMRSLQKKRRTSTPSQPVQTVRQSRYINYLQNLKSKSQYHTSSMDWQRDMRDKTSSRVEKRQRVIMKSKLLEQKALRDEKLVSHYNYGNAQQIIAKKREIDDTLLSSIKAKVAVLKDARAP